MSASMSNGSPQLPSKEYRWSTRVKCMGETFARVDNPNMYIMIDRRSRSLKKAVKVPLNSKISWS